MATLALEGRKPVMKTPLLVLLAVSLASCGFPYDSAGTLDRIRGEGVLRVGVVESPPWTLVSDDGVSGIEPSLAMDWADDLGVKVEWVTGSETRLVKALEKHKIHLLAAGLPQDTPWIDSAAATLPYGPDRIMLVSAGENALLLALDRFIARQRPLAAREIAQ